MAKETKAIEGRREVEEGYSTTNSSGIAGDPSFEEGGYFYNLNNEKVIEGDNDCRIVLGRDRNSGPGSGYGGLGYTRAAAIDIVAGSVTNNWSKQNLSTQKSGIWINPDFQSDAARIHISQKTDIDDNFSLPEGRLGKGNAGNSGIGIKADNIRIISRESIKLVSSVSTTDSTGLNCAGSGIELIALNEEIDVSMDPPVMQPIPKGYNVEKAFEEVLGLLEEVTAIFASYVILQVDLNNYFACHTHLETFQGNQGIPSIDVQAPLYQSNMQVLKEVQDKIRNFKQVHLNNFKTNYISSVSDSPTYINSKYHYLN
jgi:hypothetical protein